MMIVLLSFIMSVIGCHGLTDTEYILNFDSPVYMCSDDDSQAFMDVSGVTVQRYNETTAFMGGNVNFLKSLDHLTMLEILVDKEVSGRYEMILSHEICDLCTEIGNGDSNYYKYLKYFGFPEKCPFEAASYPVKDLVAETDDVPINAANAGRYQVTMNFYNNPDSTCKNVKTFIACLKLDFIIEPL